MNSFHKVISNFLIFLLSLFSVLFSQSKDNIAWKEDLKVYLDSLEQKHINLYHSVTKEEFIKEWNKIYQSTETSNDFEIILKIMRLTRSINDGHTSVSLSNYSTHRFPIEIKQIEDQWLVVKTLNENKDILNTTLESINGIPIKKVAQEISEIAQFVENEYSLKERTGNYLPTAELLFHLKLLNSENTATFSFRKSDSGQLIGKSLTALEDEIWQDKRKVSEILLTVPEIEYQHESNPDLWFSPVLGTNAIYINFKSYPTFEKMQIFGEQLVTYIQENQIKEVIIDMRENGGGDLYVGTVLAYALNLADSINWKNGVYVLTGNKTFSAASSNAALFRQLLNAKIIGEPTGSNPNGYQDMDSFTLPNSKLMITYSKRLFRLSNEHNQALKPDIIIEPGLKDYRKQEDIVLSKLIRRIKKYELN